MAAISFATNLQIQFISIHFVNTRDDHMFDANSRGCVDLCPIKNQRTRCILYSRAFANIYSVDDFRCFSLAYTQGFELLNLITLAVWQMHKNTGANRAVTVAQNRTRLRDAAVVAHNSSFGTTELYVALGVDLRMHLFSLPKISVQWVVDSRVSSCVSI